MMRHQPGRGASEPTRHHIPPATDRTLLALATTTLTLLLALVLGVALAPPGWADAEHAAIHNRARGATHPLDRGPFDQVDLFNGNLLYALRLGHSYPLPGDFSYQLTLHYNALMWDFDTSTQDVAAHPMRDANAGLGWDLSWGRLRAPTVSSNPTGRWLFVDRDGRQHRFYDTLHPGDTPVASTRYSRGGRYLQLLASGGHASIAGAKSSTSCSPA